MNPVNFKQRNLFIIITILSVFVSNYATADLLDGVKNKTKLINDLKDVYRAYNINHIIADQKESINLSADEGSKKELDALLKGYIIICYTLKQTHFFNDTLNTYEGRYLTLTIQNYKIAINNGFSSKIFKKDYKIYGESSDRYFDYLSRVYPIQRFVNMKEDEYWKLNDKRNYIRSTDYSTYEKLKKTNIKAALQLLKQISDKTTNFQEYSIYQIEIADEYVKHGDSLGEDSEVAIKKYKDILDQKKYSIYLFESWLKWRTVLQYENGLSKSSDIPNDEYNKVREQTALTILNQINEHPDDRMAINEFLLVATHDIVKRFGPYPYGNQNTVEYHEIFDDEK